MRHTRNVLLLITIIIIELVDFSVGDAAEARANKECNSRKQKGTERESRIIYIQSSIYPLTPILSYLI